VNDSDHVWLAEQQVNPAIDWPAGWQLWYVDETGSTNLDLLAAATDGAPDRTVLRTDHQTAGRGRLDRRWDAPAGSNLLVSILFRNVPADSTQLTQRIALSACAAVRAISNAAAALKWPNDLLVDGRKLGGILAQRTSDGCVVVGLGLNVGWAPEGAACLETTAHPAALLAELLRAFDELPGDTHELYRRALATLGQPVTVEMPTGSLTGTAVDVDRDGRLVVLDHCAVTHRVDVGDIVHLRTT
jgi:BirA family biotin operon repressor/biotin-[acetyl-CoA-carboxylase] ligase